MWRMLTSRGRRAWRSSWPSTTTPARAGSRATTSPRPVATVVNDVRATFRFDGRPDRRARRPLLLPHAGPGRRSARPGLLLGWTPILQAAVRKQGARRSSTAFRAARGERCRPRSSPARRASSAVRCRAASAPRAGRVRALARSDAQRAARSRANGAEAGARRSRRRRGDAARGRGLRRRVPLRRAPRGVGRRGGVRARATSRAPATRSPPRARPASTRFVHVGTEAALLAGRAADRGRRARTAALRLAGAVLADEGAGRGGGRRRPTLPGFATVVDPPAARLGTGRHDDPARARRGGAGRASSPGSAAAAT